MSSQLTPEQQRVLANRRRQSYYRNRRLVQRIERDGTVLAPEHMSVYQLTATLETSLLFLLQRLSDGTSPSLYTAARDAYECLAAILDRGEQLKLI